MTATAKLFEHGLADPRGCEYRAIDVVAGSVWGGAGAVKTQGWVLPAAVGSGQRFAVCWNGLVYPVVTVREKVSLREKLLAVVKVDQQRRTEYARKNPDFPFWRFQRATPEASSLSVENVAPLKSCLLLRVGEADLARRVWMACTGEDIVPAKKAESAARQSSDPYLELASAWGWSLWDRAVCAHMRGDDRLALLSARALTIIAPKIEAEAVRRKLPRPDGNSAAGKKAPYLSFLSPLPALLADQERRAREAKPVRNEDVDVLTLPRNASSIARLINDLDTVAARQWGQPGGVSLDGDPIVMALMGQGDAAVEPLLAVLESDARLTRSVQFHRDFGTQRSLLSVANAAYVALVGILKTSSFGPYETDDKPAGDGRRAVAASIRAYWNRNKGVALEQRWYRTLADDKASAEQWLQAAKNIVQRSDIAISAASMLGGWVTVPPRGGELPRMHGEGLRSLTNPSVSELMAKRVEDIYTRAKAKQRLRFDLEKATEMALALARWDAAAATPALQLQMKLVREELEQPLRNSYDWRSLGKQIVLMTLARVRGNDAAALPDFAAWMRTVPANTDLNYELDKVFEPLWRYGDHPAIKETAEWLFNDPRSPWNPLFQVREGSNASRPMELLESPLVGLASLRTQLLHELANKKHVGTITIREEGQVIVESKSGWNTSTSYNKLDPLAPAVGTKVALRVADLYAGQLARLGGMPGFQLYWPEAKRDEALAAQVQFLRQYGDCYAYSALQEALQDSPFETKAYFTLPPLQQPATPEDVRQGKAIFSLAGEGEVRSYKLPRLPLKAKWVTLRSYPHEVTGISRDGKRISRTEYAQDGVVWQAEEVFKDGQWQRYYGFVGPGGIDKVRAAEIEFQQENRYAWIPLIRHFDVRLNPPGVTHRENLTEQKSVAVGQPLIASVYIRNRGGVEQRVQNAFYSNGPGGPSLRDGVEIHLAYTALSNRHGMVNEEERNWQELKPKNTARFEAKDAGRVLAPAEEFKAFELDLNDWFDIARPGYYRLWFRLLRANPGEPGGETRKETFQLLPGKPAGSVP